MSLGQFVLLALALQTLGLIRVRWVYRQRMRVLRTYPLSLYQNMPSFNAMVLTFWVWNVKKYLPTYLPKESIK
ncbi:hypothetical protein ERD95_15430 [Enterobacteriaceae bacterium ML5]|nr:hypothetical protein ERD95_15430 [Enterobacteriaceae bacterium ML5]